LQLNFLLLTNVVNIYTITYPKKLKGLSVYKNDEMMDFSLQHYWQVKEYVDKHHIKHTYNHGYYFIPEKYFRIEND